MISEIRIPENIVLERKINEIVLEVNQASVSIALVLGRTEGLMYRNDFLDGDRSSSKES